MGKTYKLESRILRSFGKRIRKQVLDKLRPCTNETKLLVDTLELSIKLDKTRYSQTKEVYYEEHDKLLKTYMNEYKVSMYGAYSNINTIKRFMRKNMIDLEGYVSLLADKYKENKGK